MYRTSLCTWQAILCGVPLLTAAACSGRIGEPEPPAYRAYDANGGRPAAPVVAAANGGNAAASSQAASAASGGSGGSAPVALDCMPGVLRPGPSYLRRLNRFEYNNSVHDLLADTTRPADAFPPEEKSLGFDNNATALGTSPALVEQYLNAAEALAANAVKNLGRLTTCDPASKGAAACGDDFIQSFGKKVYRRPLSSEERSALRSVFDVGAQTDFATGVRLTLEVMLQSPAFLYRVEFGAAPQSGERVVRLTSHEMASRLSYLVWQSTPDAELQARADQDALRTPDQIGAQVERMLNDPRARGSVAHFHDQWLQLDRLASLDKDAQLYPAYTPDLLPLMREELRLYLDYIVWTGPGTLDALLTSPVTFANQKLASYYGVSGPTSDQFQQVTLDDKRYAGLLTRSGIMAMLGKPNQTDPVHRGKFVREQLLCNQMPPPPANLMIKAPELSATLSTRERFTQHRTDPACNGCHQLMDPIGLGFEAFDGAGRLRTQENGQAIDTTGEVASSDITGPFDGAIELSSKLAGSEQVRQCVATSWFRYAYGRGETPEDACTIDQVQARFRDADYDLKSLIVALTQTDAFQYRRVVTPGGTQ